MKGRRLRIVFGKETTYFVNDKEITKEEYEKEFPPKSLEEIGPCDGHRPGIWPMYSEALAVHPDQVDEANERARKCGIGARYQKGTGVCEIDSDGDKVKLVNLEGFVNKQAGYR